MRIDSAGNVSFNLPSIGGTRELQFPAFNATNAKTIIRAVGTSDYRQHLDILMNTAQADIAPTPVVRIENSGNVGIGSDSPSAKLEISNSSGNSFKSSSTATAGFNASEFYNDNSKGWAQYLYGSAYSGGTYLNVGANGAVQAAINTTGAITTVGAFDFLLGTNSTERMRIDSSGNVGIGTAPYNFGSGFTTLEVKDSTAGILKLGFDSQTSFGSRIQAQNDDGLKIINTEPSAFISFATVAGERMRINSVGNVGIGQTNPTANLHIKDLSTSTDIRIEDSTGGTTLYLQSQAGLGVIGTISSHDLRFDTGDTSRMRITSAGNVGIGTDSPRADAFTVGLTIGNTTTGAAQLVLEENTLAGGWRIQNNGFLGFYANNDERMRITSEGDVIINSNSSAGENKDKLVYSPTASWIVQNHSTARTSGSHYNLFYYGTTAIGSITQSGTTGVSYNETSDYRLKENVVPITGALDRVDALKPSRFNFIADADTTVDGFLAHELAEVVPEAVTGEKDAVDEEGNAIYQGIDKGKIVPLLVGAIQELKAEIETLKSQINN